MKRLSQYFALIDGLLDEALDWEDLPQLKEPTQNWVLRRVMKETKGHLNPAKVREDILRAFEYRIH